MESTSVAYRYRKFVLIIELFVLKNRTRTLLQLVSCGVTGELLLDWGGT